jgi:hypothetical protein
VLINVLIFFVLFNILYWSIPTVATLATWIRFSDAGAARRAIPPAYDPADATWVPRHWIESQPWGNVYRSYIGWRRAPYAGETVNVEGPYLQRRTVNAGTAGDKKAYFFGGSTMWGIGTDDARTIPSQFAALTGLHAENFGEDGWVAHQSLMLLIQLLQAGHRPELVVFYDGVNDALQKCRSELTADAHEREREFDRVLRASVRPDSFGHYLAPVMQLAQKLNDRLGIVRGGPEWYECHRNPQKAAAIADNLIQDWRLAKQLVDGYGGKFVGILQPVAYFSHTRLDHLRLSPTDAQQYGAVYPLIRETIARGGEFHDLVPVLDRDAYLYLDWCHLGPNGNRLVVERIAALVAPLGFHR